MLYSLNVSNCGNILNYGIIIEWRCKIWRQLKLELYSYNKEQYCSLYPGTTFGSNRRQLIFVFFSYSKRQFCLLHVKATFGLDKSLNLAIFGMFNQQNQPWFESTMIMDCMIVYNVITIWGTLTG
jgi:hypothetical protein